MPGTWIGWSSLCVILGYVALRTSMFAQRDITRSALFCVTFCELLCGFTALQTNATLTSLNLEYNGIGAAGATALATALQTNTALTELKLVGNRIGDAVAVALLSARLSCTVHLDRNHFHDAQDCCTQMLRAGASWDLSSKELSARDVDWLAVALGDPRVCCFAHLGRDHPFSMCAD